MFDYAGLMDVSSILPLMDSPALNECINIGLQGEGEDRGRGGFLNLLALSTATENQQTVSYLVQPKRNNFKLAKVATELTFKVRDWALVSQTAHELEQVHLLQG